MRSSSFFFNLELTVMAKNIDTLAILKTIQKMQPFSQKIVAVANVFLHRNTKSREEKSNLIQFHTEPKKCTGQNYWHLIFNINIWYPLWKKLLKSITSCNHEWVSYTSLLEFWTTLLLQTAPVHSDLKDAFSQLLFWDLSTGVLWDSDLDSLLAISELSSTLFVTISLFKVCIGLLYSWKTHDLWWRRSFLTLATILRPKFLC